MLRSIVRFKFATPKRLQEILTKFDTSAGIGVILHCTVSFLIAGHLANTIDVKVFRNLHQLTIGALSNIAGMTTINEYSFSKEPEIKSGRVD